MSFSKDFTWGAAAASYQIEGAAYEDGKGLSVWDILCKKSGAIKNLNTGDVACDHYHRYKEDVQLIKEMGLQAYRLSISWPRVMPAGIGQVNQKGLDFYDRLIDELLHNGITPYVTLFHWDYPYELYKKGGWLNDQSPDWFAEYTRVIVDRLSDRVKHWITLNEPQCFILLGHLDGIHAPGLKLDIRDVILAGHHALLAHGKAAQVIRNCSKQKCEIGMAPVGSVKIPHTDSPQDIEAAKKAMFGFIQPTLWVDSWFSDPVYLGQYPEQGLDAMREYLPDIKQEDMKTIFQPLDFYGVNIYRGGRIKHGENGTPQQMSMEIGYPRTAFNWEITPECLYWGPKFYYERYKKPILITENGLSNTDWVALDGQVHDPQRIDFLKRHLLQLHKAGEEGAELKGYFCWSIMDNFEWAEGYNERFGLIHVDFKTQKRIIKDSGYWYKKVIESNGTLIFD